MPPSVLIVGGGLAGLATAVALASRGFRVTILESRSRLGGRATSFADPATGQLVDACQHVTMGCCTNFAHFCRTVGIAHYLAPQPVLHFATPDRRMSRFVADPWPAPFHLGRALASAHYLTAGEKMRVAFGMVALLRESSDADPPLRDWLLAHRQTQRTIDRFWGVVLISALNETVERAGLKYARKVLVDGFLRHRDGFTIHVPTVPLSRFYGDELCTWLARHGVEVRMNAGVKRLVVEKPLPHTPSPQREGGADSSSPPRCGDGFLSHALLRDGTSLAADHFVLAGPFERVPELLPESLRDDPFFAAAKGLEPSPITSVHFWFNRPVLDRPHAVLLDGLGQWVFNRGEVAPGEYYLQVVISAARGVQRSGLVERIRAELARPFPWAKSAMLLRSIVVTEQSATFAAVPGVDRFRPTQATPVPNLVLAGDWTATGWPATMEGAVRSGYLAAEEVLARVGRPDRVLCANLGRRHLTS